MGRFLAAALAALLLAACGTSRSHTFSGDFASPPAQSRILIVAPDVQLNVLTAAGLQEPREDWSQAGRTNLAAAIAAHMNTTGHNPSALDPTQAMEGRVGQLIRLHDAVGQSILAVNYMAYSLPTKREGFDWTLGPGVSELAAAQNADYALFITARGSYASAGRVAASIGLAILGVGVPLGGQQAFASLVDLRTGQVIWFNVAVAAPGEDMRESTGAADLTQRLMTNAPL